MQDYASIQAAITAAGPNSTVVVSDGVYTVAAPTRIHGFNNFKLLLSPNAVIRAASGVGSDPLLWVYDSDNVTVQGGVWDGNSLAGYCVRIATTGDVAHSGVTIRDLECKNTTRNGLNVGSTGGVQQAYRQSNTLFEHNYVHDVGRHGIAFVYVDGGKAINNRIDKVLADYAGISMSGTHLKALANRITNVQANARGISGYGGEDWDIGANEISCANTLATSDESKGVWSDTVIGVHVHDNHVDRCDQGIVTELSPNSVIENNRVDAAINYGVFVEGRTDNPQVNALDNTTALVAGTGVVLGTDRNDKQEGAASVTVTAAGLNPTFTGTLFYQNFDSDQVWGPYLNLWIKPRGASILPYSANLVVSTTVDLGNIVSTIPIPAVDAEYWAQLRLPDPQFYPKWIKVRSWGIQVVTPGLLGNVLGDLVLHVDDLRWLVSSDHVTVANNQVVRSRNMGVVVAAAGSDIAVTDNQVDGTGWRIGPSAAVYGINVHSHANNTVTRVHIERNIITGLNGLSTTHDITTQFGIYIDQATRGGTIDQVQVLHNRISNVDKNVGTSGTVTGLIEQDNGPTTSTAVWTQPCLFQ